MCIWSRFNTAKWYEVTFWCDLGDFPLEIYFLKYAAQITNAPSNMQLKSPMHPQICSSNHQCTLKYAAQITNAPSNMQLKSPMHPQICSSNHQCTLKYAAQITNAPCTIIIVPVGRIALGRILIF